MKHNCFFFSWMNCSKLLHPGLEYLHNAVIVVTMHTLVLLYMYVTALRWISRHVILNNHVILRCRVMMHTDAQFPFSIVRRRPGFSNCKSGSTPDRHRHFVIRKGTVDQGKVKSLSKSWSSLHNSPRLGSKHLQQEWCNSMLSSSASAELTRRLSGLIWLAPKSASLTSHYF